MVAPPLRESEMNRRLPQGGFRCVASARSPYFHDYDQGRPRSRDQLSFEEALAELEKIVAHLERGDVPLADSIRIYKRGAALKARCEGQLKDAQLEVDQIVMGPDGPRTEPAKLGQ